MASSNNQGDRYGRESIELKQSTLVSGAHHEAGESVTVYPFERRHLVSNNYANGGLEDIASPAEIEQGNLEIFLRKEDEQVWHQGDDEGVKADEGHEEG